MGIQFDPSKGIPASKQAGGLSLQALKGLGFPPIFCEGVLFCNSDS
jgi:hypothetical protein